MTTSSFPNLDPRSVAAMRDALQAYARVLGAWMTTCRSKRKHWWQISLRPSLNGLTTDVIHADIDFELQLNLRESLIQGRTSNGQKLTEALRGQQATELAAIVRDFLVDAGIDNRFVPEDGKHSASGFTDYSAEHARTFARVLNLVAAAMESFRAGIREETSPIQLWPHHFDLAMLWLPGGKVPGQNLENEEYADQQMNFGFTFGDEGIPKPYFYITAYPLPEAFLSLELPPGTTWQSEGFTGAVLPYRSLVQTSDPAGYLLDLWNRLLSAGHEHMATA